MKQPPVDPERVVDETARRLLERAAALETDGPTLAQLRQAAAEAGISNVAFDAAVAEWRAHLAHEVAPASAEADKRFVKLLRLCRNSFLTRLQLGDGVSQTTQLVAG